MHIKIIFIYGIMINTTNTITKKSSLMSTTSMNSDVHINELEKNVRDGYIESSLVLEFTGKNINHVVINTLRRIMIQDLPMYAFAPECMIIGKNSSKFNNDQIRERFMQLPVFDTPVNIHYLPAKYWKEINYANDKREKHQEEKSIEIYIVAHNETNEILNITTSDVKYLEDGKEIKNKYKSIHPILLLKLCPTEEFQCKMKAVLGVGERNDIWSSVETATYNELSEHNIKFKIDSQGQFDEYEIIVKACYYLVGKCEQVKEYIHSHPVDHPTNMIHLTLTNEDHTLGGILTDFLQDYALVKYAGMEKPHRLEKEIIIKIEYNKEIPDPFVPIIESLDNIIKLYNQIAYQLYQLGHKYINYDPLNIKKKN